MKSINKPDSSVHIQSYSLAHSYRCVGTRGTFPSHHSLPGLLRPKFQASNRWRTSNKILVDCHTSPICPWAKGRFALGASPGGFQFSPAPVGGALGQPWSSAVCATNWRTGAELAACIWGGILLPLDGCSRLGDHRPASLGLQGAKQVSLPSYKVSWPVGPVRYVKPKGRKRGANAQQMHVCPFPIVGTITQSNQALFLHAYAYDGVMFERGAKCPTCSTRKPARSKHCGELFRLLLLHYSPPASRSLRPSRTSLTFGVSSSCLFDAGSSWCSG